MVYNGNVPTGDLPLDVDYQNLQNNFNQANVQFGIDHIPFNNSGMNGTGFHKQVSMANRIDPGVLPAGVNTITYCKNDGSGNPQLFMYNGVIVQQLTGGGNGFGITSSGNSNIAGNSLTAVFPYPGYDYLGTAISFKVGGFNSCYAIGIIGGANYAQKLNANGNVGFTYNATTTLNMLNNNAGAVNGISWAIVIAKV